MAPASSGPSSPTARTVRPSHPRRTTLTVNGILTLTDPAGVAVTGTGCAGRGGYDDIRDGAQVVVSDPTGRTVGVGQLGAGSANPMNALGDLVLYYCAFTFHLQVPAGLGYYGIEVSHRGRIQYPEAQLAGRLELTLG